MADSWTEDSPWEDWSYRSFAAVPKWQQGDDYGRATTRELTLMFSDGVTTRYSLVANVDQTQYDSLIIPQEWHDHGVETVWVTVSRHSSRICVRLIGKTAALTVTKNY